MATTSTVATLSAPPQQERSGAALWFEIPATDFDRAATFYETILGTSLIRRDLGPDKMGIFPYSKPDIGGCVIFSPEYVPGTNGPVIYVNANPSMDAVLARVESAGGKIVHPRTELPPGLGCYAHILDTEGNRVGLGALA